MADTIGKIQLRYGWSDEYILSVPYARFLQIVEQIFKAEESRLDEISFLAWQMLIPNMDKDKPPLSFKQYKAMLFGEDEEGNAVEQVDTKEASKRAIQRAEDILKSMSDTKRVTSFGEVK